MSHMIAEALRISHCANPDRIHNCAGTCLITSTGIKLDCKLCGDAQEGLNTSIEYMKLERLLNLIGIDINMITNTVVRDMIEELKKR